MAKEVDPDDPLVYLHELAHNVPRALLRMDPPVPTLCRVSPGQVPEMRWTAHPPPVERHPVGGLPAGAEPEPDGRQLDAGFFLTWRLRGYSLDDSSQAVFGPFCLVPLSFPL